MLTNDPMRLSFVFVFLVLIKSLQAQDVQPLPSQLALKVSPLHLFSNSAKLGVERFNKSYAQSWGLYFTGQWSRANQNNSQHQHMGFGAELQYRKYIRPLQVRTSSGGKNHYRGSYVMLGMQASHHSEAHQNVSYSPPNPLTGEVTVSSYDYKIDTGNGAITIALGVQQVFWNVILLDIFVGGGYQFSDPVYIGQFYEHWVAPRGIREPSYQGLLPRIGVDIGIPLYSRKEK
jgi:hypothetical protein